MVKSPEISKAMADEKAEALVGTGADVVAGADLGCLMNISDALNRRRSSIRVKHIASILEEASRDRG
jgi:L-lactate dehydrogenase complex protein LldE